MMNKKEDAYQFIIHSAQNIASKMYDPRRSELSSCGLIMPSLLSVFGSKALHIQRAGRFSN